MKCFLKCIKHENFSPRRDDSVLVSILRGQRLEESLEYQQFVANVEEEEAWINEKMTLVASEDYGDTLAAIQVRENLMGLKLLMGPKGYKPLLPCLGTK